MYWIKTKRRQKAVDRSLENGAPMRIIVPAHLCTDTGMRKMLDRNNRQPVPFMTLKDWYDNHLMRYVKMLDKWKLLGKIDDKKMYRYNEKLLEWYENVSTYIHEINEMESIAVIVYKNSLHGE